MEAKPDPLGIKVKLPAPSVAITWFTVPSDVGKVYALFTLTEPALNFPATPTPPATFSAPVVVDDDAVVLLKVIAFDDEAPRLVIF